MAREQKPFHIFACGVLGAGKSSIINDLLGYQICTVEDPLDTFHRQISDPGFPAKQLDYETKPENETLERVKTAEELEVRIEPEINVNQEVPKIEMLNTEDRLTEAITEAEIIEPKTTEVHTSAHEVRVNSEVPKETNDPVTEMLEPTITDSEVEMPAHEVIPEVPVLTEVETPAHEVGMNSKVPKETNDRVTEIREPQAETPAHGVIPEVPVTEMLIELETPAYELGMNSKVPKETNDRVTEMRGPEVETPAHGVIPEVPVTEMLTEVETPDSETSLRVNSEVSKETNDQVTEMLEPKITEVETPAHEVTPKVAKEIVTEMLTEMETPAHEVRMNPKDQDTEMLEHIKATKVETLAPDTEVPKETKVQVVEVTDPKITEVEMHTHEIGVNLETPRIEMLKTEGRVIEAEKVEPKKEVETLLPENKGNPEVETLEPEDQVRTGNSDVKTTESINRLKVEITGIETFQQSINGVVVTVFEALTQQETHVSGVNYLQHTLEKCQEADLVLFCLDMRTCRWTDQEKDSIKSIAQTFEKEFWNRCVLVLTKANMIRVPTEERKDNRGYHERIYKQLHNEFRQQLASEGVPQSIVNSIPAVAAGEVDDDDIVTRSLYYTSEKDSFAQNERKDYLTELWLTCLERTERKRDFLDITTAGRLNLKKSDNKDDKWMLEHIKHYLEKDFPKKHKSGYASLVEHKGATLQLDTDQLKRIKLTVNVPDRQDVPDRQESLNVLDKQENQQKKSNCCTYCCQKCIIL